MVKVFISYSHVDVQFKEQLEKHLAALRRNGEIEPWTDTMISPSEAWNESISKSLHEADIIICLISSDFINSDYCYEIELKDALNRHKENKARVIPIIIRSCDWNDTPFAQLQVLPTQGRPIKDWYDQDQAFLDVVEGLKKSIKLLTQIQEPKPIVANVPPPPKKDSVASDLSHPSHLHPASTHHGKRIGKKTLILVAVAIIVVIVLIYFAGGSKPDEVVSTDAIPSKEAIMSKSKPLIGFVKHLSTQDLLIICLIGAVAGWVAGNLVNSGRNSLLLDIVIGIVGGYIGYLLFGNSLSITGNIWANKIITATAGATVLALTIKIIRGAFRLS